MQRISVVLLFIVWFATAMQAQAPAPKPAPELKKLDVFVGHWTYVEDDSPGPLHASVSRYRQSGHNWSGGNWRQATVSVHACHRLEGVTEGPKKT